MRASWELFALITALFGSVNGQLSTSTVRQSTSSTRLSSVSSSTRAVSSTTVRLSSSSVRLSSSVRASSAAVTTPSSTATSALSPCGRVSSSLAYIAAHPQPTKQYLSPILALSCLESVPLHVQKSLDFIDYISPYIEFQSTLAYLKDPPIGYPMAGVDVLEGLKVIRSKISKIDYNNQYEFERELHILINVRPRDFHFNLPLPLIDLFTFTTPDECALGSISSDGKALPDIYFVADLYKKYVSKTALSWKPSPLVTINGQVAADYVLRAGLETQQWADPDAVYNRMFITPALAQSEGGNSWVSGGHNYGFAMDSNTYVFANGTTRVIANRATTYQPWSGVASGEDVWTKFEIPRATSSTKKKRFNPYPIEKRSTTSMPASTSTRVGTSTRRSTSTRSVATNAASSTIMTGPPGYPTPVVIDPLSGYTGGYFLPNSSVAVLVMTAFAGDAGQGIYDQQVLISQFLAKCKAAGKTKLIVDVQANGGGYIFNGEDTFLQLFPSYQILGATRTRWTPFIDTLSKMYEAVTSYTSFSSYFQYQYGVNVNLQNFKTAQEFLGPVSIYGDNFTSILRPNLTRSDAENRVVNITKGAPQPFLAENIVLLLDGLCGSTCAIFAELMASQAGVRSVVVGGRPMVGPMQTIAGSKGAQVLSYGEIQEDWLDITKYYNSRKLPIPNFPNATQYNISLLEPPIGSSLDRRARFNLRNNYNSTAVSEVPLQFVYEPANCRLFWQYDDLFNMENMWEKVAEVTWGKGKCVPGSSVMKDDTMPKYAWQLVKYDSKCFSNFTLNTGLPGTVYKDVNEKATQVVFTMGEAIKALWAW